MSKKNLVIWIVIIVGTFLLVTVGRRLVGYEAGSSFISTSGSLIVMGVSLGSFFILKKK
jgi:purine-cytosine permease-like protein